MASTSKATAAKDVQASKQVAKHHLSIETAIEAVTNSLSMGRKALNMELAVCLAIFAAENSAEEQARQMVMEVYAKSGYELQDSHSRHYKTVNRRLNASASLFKMIGAAQVLDWVGEAQEQKMLESIVQGLSMYKFDSMDDVLEFCGRPNNRSRQAKEEQDKTSQQNAQGQGETTQGNGQVQGTTKMQPKRQEVKMVKFRSHKVVVEIPESASAEDMLKVAAKIIRAAREKEQLELREAIAHPSTAVVPTVLATVH